MFSLPGKHESFAVLAKDGRIQYCSPAFAHLMALSQQDLGGSHIDHWLDLLETPPASPWYLARASFQGHVWHRKRALRLRFKLDPMIHDQQSSGAMFFLCEAESAQKTTLDELYSRAFHLNPGLSAISILETGEHLDVNGSWLEAMGYQRSDVIGRTAAQMHVWEHGDHSRAEIVRQLRQYGKIENLEARLRTKDERLLDIIVSAELVEHHGQLLAFFASHDVTRLKQANEARLVLQQNLENWRNMAFLDGLTGIPNRRRFDEMLDKEWRRCARQQSPLSLLMIDIDHFKHYNDYYGHQTGDDCLRVIAQSLNDVVQRPGDLLCRYGGEEFACILPDTDEDGASRIADRMLQRVRDLAIPNMNSPIAHHVTLSIGQASTLPDTLSSSTRLLQQADHMLYQSKLSGRDRSSHQ